MFLTNVDLGNGTEEHDSCHRQIVMSLLHCEI